MSNFADRWAELEGTLKGRAIVVGVTLGTTLIVVILRYTVFGR